MRKPNRRRGNPKQLAIGPIPANVDLAQVASRAQYIGSVIHKDSPSFAGSMPHPQPARSVCPRALNQNRAHIQQWLQAAIVAGRCGSDWISGFPKYVYHRAEETVFCGQLMSPYGQGHYKGYPLERYQEVRGLP
jgi:hypothetical protein